MADSRQLIANITMVTQSHVILNIAILSKRDKPFLHSYAFLGAVLPDLPMFIFFIVESLIRKTPQRELWGSRYFAEAWQTFFDLFNAIPLILIVLGLGYYLLNSEKIVVFAWSMLIHCCFDFMTHHDDGHHHQLNGLETQSFRFGRKNRPLGKDQSVKKTLDFQSKLLYN